LGNYAWFDENREGQAHEVRRKRPNPLGLYDMHGNVWEWVRDWYNDYTSGVFVDPPGPNLGKCSQELIRAFGLDASVACRVKWEEIMQIAPTPHRVHRVMLVPVPTPVPDIAMHISYSPQGLGALQATSYGPSLLLNQA
jgi:hypothetical protein